MQSLTNLGPTWSNLNQRGPNFGKLGCKICHLRTKMALNCTILNKVDNLICENSLFFLRNLYVLRMSTLMQSLANLGPPWTNFYPTWGILGPNLHQLGANLRQLGADLGHFAPNLGQLNAKFDPTWVNLGPPRANLGRPWTNLRLTWGELGPIWSQSGPTCLNLASAWNEFGTKLS